MKKQFFQLFSITIIRAGFKLPWQS